MSTTRHLETTAQESSDDLEILIIKARGLVDAKYELGRYEPETVVLRAMEEATYEIDSITKNLDLNNQQKIEKLRAYCTKALREVQEKFRESVEELRQIGLHHITTLKETRLFLDITKARSNELDRLCNEAKNKEDLEKITSCNTSLEALVKLAQEKATNSSPATMPCSSSTRNMTFRRIPEEGADKVGLYYAITKIETLRETYYPLTDQPDLQNVGKIITDRVNEILENPLLNDTQKIQELDAYYDKIKKSKPLAQECPTDLETASDTSPDEEAKQRQQEQKAENKKHNDIRVLSGIHGIIATDSEQKASLIKKTADRQPTSPEFSDSEEENPIPAQRKSRMKFNEEEKTSIEQARRDAATARQEGIVKLYEEHRTHLDDLGTNIGYMLKWLTDRLDASETEYYQNENNRLRYPISLLFWDKETPLDQLKIKIQDQINLLRKFNIALTEFFNQQVKKYSGALLEELKKLFIEYLTLVESVDFNNHADEITNKRKELHAAEKNIKFVKDVDKLSKDLFLKTFTMKYNALCEKMGSAPITQRKHYDLMLPKVLFSLYSREIPRDRETEQVLNQNLDSLNKIYEQQKAEEEKKKRPPLEHAIFIATQRARGLTETLEGINAIGPLHLQLKTTTESKPDEGMDANEFAQSKLQMLNAFISFLETKRVSSLKETLLDEITELKKELKEIVCSADYQHYFRTYFGTPEAISEFDRVAQEYVIKELDYWQNQFNKGGSAFEFTMKKMQSISNRTRDLVNKQKAKLKSSLNESINELNDKCSTIINQLRTIEGSEEDYSKRNKKLKSISISVLTRKDLKKIEKYEAELSTLIKPAQEEAKKAREKNKSEAKRIISELGKHGITKRECDSLKAKFGADFIFDKQNDSAILTSQHLKDKLIPALEKQKQQANMLEEKQKQQEQEAENKKHDDITAKNSEQKASQTKETTDRQPTSLEFSDSEREKLISAQKKLKMEFDKEEKTSIEQARRERQANYEAGLTIIAGLANKMSEKAFCTHKDTLSYWFKHDEENDSAIGTCINLKGLKICGMLHRLKSLVSSEEYNGWTERWDLGRSSFNKAQLNTFEEELEKELYDKTNLKENLRVATEKATALTNELEAKKDGPMHAQLESTINAEQDHRMSFIDIENKIEILNDFIAFLEETRALLVKNLKETLLAEIAQLQNELKETVKSKDYPPNFRPDEIISSFENDSNRDKKRLETLYKEFDEGQSTFNETMANMQEALTAARNFVSAERNKLDTAKKEREEKAELEQREQRFLDLVNQKTSIPSVNASLPSSSPWALFGSTNKAKAKTTMSGIEEREKLKREILEAGASKETAEEAARKAQAATKKSWFGT